MSELQRMKWWNVAMVVLVMLLAALNVYESQEWQQVAKEAQMTSQRCLGQLEGINKVLEAQRQGWP